MMNHVELITTYVLVSATITVPNRAAAGGAKIEKM